MTIFQASTEINLGNGKKALFWYDKWLDGVAPINLAPNFYKKAHFKKRTVAKELWNKNWIYAVRHISFRHELLEFVKLWALVKNVNLTGDEQDSIL
jgi:hypothetical protein